MFKSTETATAEKVKKATLTVEKNYQIVKNDRLTIKVYSNNGERLVDTNPELSQSAQNSQANQQNEPVYLIDINGLIKLPMVNEVKLEGLTLKQAEEVLQKEYEKFFKGPFVKLTFVNKRVIVLGASGGQVIPLENENTTVVEVLALAKGLDNNAKAQNIRLLRGEKAFEIDLSTIDGYINGNMLIETGDIVYVEPVRKPVSEALRDYSGLFSILLSVVTLITLIASLN